MVSVLLMGTVGCKKEENEEPQAQFDRSAMLANYADNIIQPRYLDLKQNVDALANATAAFNQAPGLSTLGEVRNQWLAAYRSWQRAAMFEFGPAADVLLRSTCNTFPTDTADISDNISTGNWVLDAASNIDAIGFPAIDYLLHGSNMSDDAIVQLYDSAPDAENRRAYLDAVVGQVQSKVSDVVSAWSSGYRDTFVNSTGTDIGSSLSLMVNDLNRDYELIKNAKIGIPLGVQTLGIAVPEYVEAYFGEASLTLALESLRANQDAFRGRGEDGTDRTGLADYLQFLGAQHTNGPLHEAILNQFQASETALEQLESPLSERVIDSPTEVEATYTKLQQHVVLYKTDMASALSVLITYASGDGD